MKEPTSKNQQKQKSIQAKVTYNVHFFGGGDNGRQEIGDITAAVLAPVLSSANDLM